MTRAIKTLATLAMAGASVLCVTSQASADPNPNNHGSEPMMIQLDTKYHVGVYTCADSGCGKWEDLTLSPGDSILADCWVSGGNVGNMGDVWYRTAQVTVNGSTVDTDQWTWTFAPYVDGAYRFHWTSMPHC
ncbi:hypothetical protein GCM10010260_53860 [Streptomyces filipinensis]|uniref:Secreted protein n=1 Tax=Streptomyces filipinensis TaxID=66887 RepID=A0A918IEX2_9ACTN|nr:hypothetical protein [Streptomyces filipinensis]GGV09032.1 hypothetical protein GCM10010260_53860 [Streptomyces filipinensis]